ncbi:hypothetical protein HYU11_03020 [Candidatus Woesearchaeota archaeon]|nr:hypothetical protein [Candidatus Woesearchaeota archaeon]
MVSIKFLRTDQSNPVKCGRCNSEFDFSRNKACPMCNFGPHLFLINPEHSLTSSPSLSTTANLSGLPEGHPIISEFTKLMGSWGMFNSFFPGKAVLRIVSEHSLKNKAGANLHAVVEDLCKLSATTHIGSKTLSKFRGFPSNPNNPSAKGRLVWHFIRTYHEMGLLTAKDEKGVNISKIPDKNWEKVFVMPTSQGFAFAKLNNTLLDEGKGIQVLTDEEKKLILKHLKEIDSNDYREYTVLNDFHKFLSRHKRNKDEIYAWFEQYKPFLDSINVWSRKAKIGNQNQFQAQIKNLSATFGSSKIALLRELGAITDKRDDYSVIGDLK